MTQKNIQNVQTLIENNRQTSQQTFEKLESIHKEYEKERKNLIKCFNDCQCASNDIQEYKNIIDKCRKDLSKNEKDLSVYNEKKQVLTTTISEYRKFEVENYKMIEIIRKNYGVKWIQFESIWYKWNVENILLYFKYKMNRLDDDAHDDCKHGTQQDDDNDVNWDKIAKRMTEDKFKGKYLISIDKDDLKSFGFDNFGTRKEIYQIIQNLCQKYPIPKEKIHNDKIQEQLIISSSTGDDSIDKKYICPLTNKCMINPVMAFDGYCYEKEAIIDYIKKNKESPMTKEKIDDVEWAIQMLYENVTLKKEIEQQHHA